MTVLAGEHHEARPQAPAPPSSALGWSLLNQLGTRLGSFLSGVALARILVPDDYGVFAVALAAVNILISMNDLGLILAVVRYPGDPEDVAPTAVSLAVVTSALLYVACFLAAPSFARLMGAPEATGVLRLAAVAVVIDGLVAVPAALLVRNFRQDRQALAQLVAMPVGIATSVGLALAGAGAWSLAWGHLAASLTSAIMFTLLVPQRFLPGFDRARARHLLTFGLPLAGTTLVEYTVLNLDYILIGHALGPATLGLYVLAFNLSNWPVSMLTETIRRVSIAGFARLAANADELGAAFARGFGLVLTVTAPICVLLVLLALPIIRVVYGARWAPAADALRFLALLGGVRVINGFIFDVLIGAGRSRTTLRLQCTWLAILAPALLVGSNLWGLRGAAVAHAAVALVVAVPLFVRAALAVGVDGHDLLRHALRPLLGAAVAAVTGLSVLASVKGDLAQLAIGGAVIVTAYAAVAGRAALRAWRAQSSSHHPVSAS